MDNDHIHDRSDSSNTLNGVNGNDLTQTLFNGLNETLLPLQPPASEPYSNLPSGGQPSSPASVPLPYGRTGRYSPSILPLDGARHAHSFSVSLLGPRTESSGLHGIQSQERNGNILLSEQEILHGLPSINVSSGEESPSDSVPPPSHSINENVRQSEGLISAAFSSDTSPILDTAPRTLNDRDLNEHDQIGMQTALNGPMLGHNTGVMRGVTYPEGYPRSNCNTEGLNAARVLQDMMHGSALSSPIASSQQSPLYHLLQQNQPVISMAENLASDALKENHVNPIGYVPRAEIMANSLAQSSSQANFPILPDISANTQAVSHPAFHDVGRLGMGGSAPTRESQFPQRNPLSGITIQRSVNSKVLPDIVIDRTQLEKASDLEKGLHKLPEFELFCQLLRQEYRASGRVPIGGTMRRRPDLVKPNESLEDFGYPPCDGPQVQKILDSTPGLDRGTVESLKLTVLCQLDRIRRGAREALHQLSAILIDHLRFRIMTQADILDLRCKVVDRFVIARDCVMERYSHYVRSRRWIENRSTNQRRGCLTHQQNNIMRMWLYRNFKNPYPDEEEKTYIVEETKMTMEQVNNWLINARSRFWKPAMDYFDRETLGVKMSVFIQHRLKMTPEARARAVKTIGTASTHRETRR